MNKFEIYAGEITDKFQINVCYRCNCRTRTYELGHSRDHAHTKERKICLSKQPKTRISFFTFCHEVGHIVADKASYGSGVPRALAEHNATEWAKGKFFEKKIPMPRKILKLYNEYIGDKVARGLRRGLKKVPSELRRYKH